MYITNSKQRKHPEETTTIIARKWDYSERRKQLGRPRGMAEISELVVGMAQSNRTPGASASSPSGYTRYNTQCFRRSRTSLNLDLGTRSTPDALKVPSLRSLRRGSVL